ncbi:MAG: SCP2 sterol-binding domain-containing protein [Alphaproteobacteria bacterium]|nr:SCP2 sterol-binding domain-containing protein [Alphaproteobacteria bacterium]
MNKFSMYNHEKIRMFPRKFLTPLPLAPLQPLLKRIMVGVTDMNPNLFNRLGSHKNKRFLIDPTNMPFVMILCPDPEAPSLRAYKRQEKLEWDARISGTFLKLLNMIDGRLDGDALFFTRDLMLEGDTEAIVTLRNAMDDVEGNITDDIVKACGILSPIAQHALNILRKLSTY